jgi:hypothetical protein
VAEINGLTGDITTINQIIDADADSIEITGFPELTEIANQVGQIAASANFSITSPGFIEFSWSSLDFDFDGFLFGTDSFLGDSNPFIIAASSPNSAHPHINLDLDCIGPGLCSEVITIEKFASVGTYGVGMVLASDSASSTTAISDGASDLTITFNQGGSLARRTGGGSTVVGGTGLLTIAPPDTGAGNTWLAAKVNPTDGDITVINQIFDGNAETIVFENQDELQLIANQIDAELQKTVSSVQETVNQIVDVTLRTFIEFDWANSSLNNLDAHLNGPDGNGGIFHVFHGSSNLLPAAEGARLEIDNIDCLSTCKTEVITIDQFNQNENLKDEYRISLFNIDEFSQEFPTSDSSIFFNAADITMRINQGGTLQRLSNGAARIINGTNILSLTPVEASGIGNTWIAANINPQTGAVTVINELTNFTTDTEVNGLVQSIE